MEYYTNNQNMPSGGELNDSAVFSAADLGDYDRGNYVLLPEGDYEFTKSETANRSIRCSALKIRKMDPISTLKTSISTCGIHAGALA